MLPPILFTARPGDIAPAAAADDFGTRLCAEAPRLRRLAHRLLGWRAGADELDDVVQDALLKAWRHRDGFRGEASLGTWLVRIVLTTCHDHVRRRQLRYRLFGWLLPAEPEAPRAGPGDVEGGAEPAAMRVALQRLAHADREVLVLRYLEQRDIAAIATLLACSRNAVDARLSRARRRLRTELEREGAR